MNPLKEKIGRAFTIITLIGLLYVISENFIEVLGEMKRCSIWNLSFNAGYAAFTCLIAMMAFIITFKLFKPWHVMIKSRLPGFLTHYNENHDKVVRDNCRIHVVGLYPWLTLIWMVLTILSRDTFKSIIYSIIELFF